MKTKSEAHLGHTDLSCVLIVFILFIDKDFTTFNIKIVWNVLLPQYTLGTRGRTYVMITYVSKENNLGPDDKIRYIWGLKGPIFILLSAAGPHLLPTSISNVIIL